VAGRRGRIAAASLHDAMKLSAPGGAVDSVSPACHARGRGPRRVGWRAVARRRRKHARGTRWSAAQPCSGLRVAGEGKTAMSPGSRVDRGGREDVGRNASGCQCEHLLRAGGSTAGTAAVRCFDVAGVRAPGRDIETEAGKDAMGPPGQAADALTAGWLSASRLPRLEGCSTSLAPVLAKGGSWAGARWYEVCEKQNLRPSAR
jgi:hypothetical protein